MKRIQESSIRAMVKRALCESTLDFAKECVRYLKDKGYEKVYGTWTPRRINGEPTEYNFMFIDNDGQCWNFFTNDFRGGRRNVFVMIRKTAGPRDFRGERNIQLNSIDDLKRLGL